MNTETETHFTFDEALRLMRHETTIMRPEGHTNIVYAIINEELCWKMYKDWHIVTALDSETIMGTWTIS